MKVKEFLDKINIENIKSEDMVVFIPTSEKAECSDMVLNDIGNLTISDTDKILFDASECCIEDVDLYLELGIDVCTDDSDEVVIHTVSENHIKYHYVITNDNKVWIIII
jgi:hypothetical protein